jgi:hypothetical protein
VLGVHGNTLNGTLLESTAPDVVTRTAPVVAPEGTVVAIPVPVELAVKTAAVPLNVTLEAAVRMSPKPASNSGRWSLERLDPSYFNGVKSAR